MGSHAVGHTYLNDTHIGKRLMRQGKAQIDSRSGNIPELRESVDRGKGDCPFRRRSRNRVAYPREKSDESSVRLSHQKSGGDDKFGVRRDTDRLTSYKEMYRAAVFIVAAAMTNPRIPNARGTAMCQNRSPDLSECLWLMIKEQFTTGK